VRTLPRRPRFDQGRSRLAMAPDSSSPSAEHAPVSNPVHCQPPAWLATQATAGGPAN
jgi:hypothetical protein